jgi:hypothetical protein
MMDMDKNAVALIKPYEADLVGPNLMAQIPISYQSNFITDIKQCDICI